MMQWILVMFVLYNAPIATAATDNEPVYLSDQ